MTFLVLLLLAVAASCIAIYFVLKKKHMTGWMPDYLRQRLGKRNDVDGVTHVIFSFVDHYEPQWGKPNSLEVERQRVDRWMRDYPAMASKHKDADGFHPQHTFFFPEEEYRFEHLNKLAKLCRDGFGEIEVHLHHHDDNRENLTRLINGFVKTLHEDHGAIGRHPQTNKLSYAFIHGNWALDNSDPSGKNCGINDELLVLKETGCFADFTFPSAPHPTQPDKINAIYYAKDDPNKPKSHNTGVDVKVGGTEWGDLMLVNGPLMLNWKKLKKGIFPQIENADIRKGMEPTKDRVDLWVNANVHVKGRPEWKFIKVHTHGTQERDMDVLLGQQTDDMFSYLESEYNDGKKYKLHYVNSREMYNMIKAAEDGKDGDPNQYRDYFITRPVFKVKE
ncbi:hypothetical protein [Alteromonas halophila]|uniref:Uncharacterized protein n=1 Tax=Alteromonas halophila TaxID=516698 RepID=A0A918JMA6_9ALTE|nr:hypothetical protein [Alteromonas halophila]GGW87042.1 hypothetical protein GCM10007391_21070 [Alteromonas halophila]